MAASFLFLLLTLLLSTVQLGCVAVRRLQQEDTISFEQNYGPMWAEDHIKHLDGGRRVPVTMNQSSGSGFASKRFYKSGFFHLSIKLPSRDTAGIVTTFYLTSNTRNTEELDFEFLGAREGQPVTLQTNDITNGHGREQRLHLWFDPSDDFHDYRILWNPYHTVFYVDDIPIRVYKNLTYRQVEYPSQGMQVRATLWDRDSWATEGGRQKVNWTCAPFVAEFLGFSIDGCEITTTHVACSSMDWWWNDAIYKELTPSQESAYQSVVKTYVYYDYCLDKARFTVPPPECHSS